MRVHAIAACVAAALFSSGLAPTLDAQQPTRSDTLRGGYSGPSGNVDLAQLTRMVDFLRSRVAALESEVAKLQGSGPKMAAKFQAPFTVLDEDGKMIFTVGDDDYNSAFRGRVHVGPGSGGNYNLWFHTKAGVASAAIGESREGSGFISVLRNGTDAALMTVEGFELRDGSKKSLAHIGLDPANKTRARIVLRGPLHLTDPSGNTVVDAGAVQNGLGVVRTWPNAQCRAGALATCLKGVP